MHPYPAVPHCLTFYGLELISSSMPQAQSEPIRQRSAPGGGPEGEGPRGFGGADNLAGKEARLFLTLLVLLTAKFG